MREMMQRRMRCDEATVFAQSRIVLLFPKLNSVGVESHHWRMKWWERNSFINIAIFSLKNFHILGCLELDDSVIPL